MKMNLKIGQKNRGMALMIVMVVIFVLGIIAAGFAYSMKVEMRLARNHNQEADLEWLGRSGIELAKYILGQQLTIAAEPFDSLNQKWAGGTGVTNELLADINLDNNELGPGVFSIKIIDAERKYNINVADEMILKQAMNLIGVEAVDASTITESILDWRDIDDDERLSGAENRYYLNLNPSYVAKNGPLDDISELLLVKGVTPEIYWGPSGAQGHGKGAGTIPVMNKSRLGYQNQSTPMVGLIDLFTCLSDRAVNINTTSASVLQLFPGIDANTAQAIVQARAGPDNVEGNDDDTPFRNPGELMNVPGMNRQAVAQVARFFSVRSRTFEVQVDARIDNYKRTFYAHLRRNNPRDIQTLYFYWK